MCSPEPDYLTGLSRFEQWPLICTMPLLGPFDTAPGCARGHVRVVLAEWRLGYLADDAALLVSELMTNAVLASGEAGTPVGLRMLADDGQLIIEVWDQVAASPQARPAGERDEDGRGLAVVQALSRRSGVFRSHGWKAVWCELRDPRPA